jgi:hypothetical protein
MKNDKLMDAFKAFELKNQQQEDLKGGTLIVSYQSGSGISDLYDTEIGMDVVCGGHDTGKVGSVYGG